MVQEAIEARKKGLEERPPLQFLAKDYATHRTRLNALLTEGEKLVLVAHSQGNLFVNAAYDYAMEKAQPDHVKVVHVAPASETVRGEHVLADMDLVINGLRVTGNIPPNNVNVPLSHLFTDASGHLFVDTYLKSGIGTKELFKQHLTAALDEIIPYSDKDNRGFFTITMTWDGSGDIDLHVLEPDDTHVAYFNKTGNSGVLDTDNTEGYGPEHYFASCNSNQLQLGKYTIGLLNRKTDNKRMATLQLATPYNGVELTIETTPGPRALDDRWNSVIEMIYLDLIQDEYGNYWADLEAFGGIPVSRSLKKWRIPLYKTNNNLYKTNNSL